MENLKFVKIQGQRIAYSDDGSGDPLVLLHGISYSRYCFRHNVPILSRFARVICPDLIGHGKSDKPYFFDYSISNQARMVSDLCSEIGINEIVLGGCSMGGAIAMQTAIDYPKLVKKLILVDTAGMDIDIKSPNSIFRIPILGHFVAYLAASGFVRSTRARMTSDVEDESDTEFREYLKETRRPSALFAGISNMRANGTFRIDGIGRIEQKTLVVWGERDQLFSIRSARAIARNIPDSRLVVLPEAGHLPNEEKPADFNQVVIDFLLDRIPQQMGR